METILIISTLVAFLFTIVIWKIWKWFEFEAWIAPAMMEYFCKAMMILAPAMAYATQALAQLGVVMAQAQLQKERHKLQPGGIVAGRTEEVGEFVVRPNKLPILTTRKEIILRGRASGKTPFPDGEISFDRE